MTSRLFTSFSSLWWKRVSNHFFGLDFSIVAKRAHVLLMRIFWWDLALQFVVQAAVRLAAGSSRRALVWPWILWSLWIVNPAARPCKKRRRVWKTRWWLWRILFGIHIAYHKFLLLLKNFVICCIVQRYHGSLFASQPWFSIFNPAICI